MVFEAFVILLQFMLVLLLITVDQLFVLFQSIFAPAQESRMTSYIQEMQKSTYFLEKSLKQSLSLFWCVVAFFLPSNKSLRKTLATSIGPWLTVVPIQPCRTICKILGSAGSWFMAASSSAIFFWTSSMATSMGVKTIYKGLMQFLKTQHTKYSFFTCLRSMTWMRVLT